MKKAYIIVGLGFGDEGKGLATDYLCAQSINPLVIRFNGGQQAGHTVVDGKGKSHVFSNFGSGSLRNIPTYWSKFCSISPEMILSEHSILKSSDINPTLYIDHECPVTTHYDILYNRAIESTRGHLKHGSCGLGFGATIERNHIPSLKLLAQDLTDSASLKLKLNIIKEYYQYRIDKETKYKFYQFNHDLEDDKFIKIANDLFNLDKGRSIRIVKEVEIFSNKNQWQTYIFEGAQGILLDMDFGTWPFVTRSNTTSKNALNILNDNFGIDVDTNILYVTRSYQTRHGAGPILGHDSIKLINNDKETNTYNQYQENFRVSYLNLNSLKYSLKCDNFYSSGLKKSILITCLDQIGSENITYYDDNIIKETHYTSLPDLLEMNFTNSFFSFNNCSDYMKSSE